MADVRSLLRQQRASRRINHPFAAYSDAGKLLCSLCREEVKAESLWEQHIKGARHVQKAQDLSRMPTKPNGHGDGPQSNKRKHDEDSDSSPTSADDDAVQNKRSKTAMDAPARAVADNNNDKSPPKDVAMDGEQRAALTPPMLARRASVTPSHGIELQIPSRPATPRDGKAAAYAPANARHTDSPDAQTKSSAALPSAAMTKQLTQVDEDEWAAFEADIAATGASYSEDAVISAPAMSAGEHAAVARSLEEERENRRLAAEQDLVDEKEEATRALEAEFEEMEELEARVRKLKERREALRIQDTANKPSQTNEKVEESVAEAAAVEVVVQENDESDESDEEDFMGFR